MERLLLRAHCRDAATDCLRPIQHKLNNTEYRKMIGRITTALIKEHDIAFRQATERARIYVQEGFSLERK